MRLKSNLFRIAMFNKDKDFTQDKGLFTFYRQQAEIEEKFAIEKINQKLNSSSFALKEFKKLNSSHQQFAPNNNERTNHSGLNSNEKTTHKKSFSQMNKDLIKRLSIRNQQILNGGKNPLASEVVVINRENMFKNKDDLKLNKLNLRYEMQDGYFLKQKIFDPLQEGLIVPNCNTERNLANSEESQIKKRVLKRNKSFNQRQNCSRTKLQNSLILSKELKPNRQNVTSQMFEGLKKVELQSQLQISKQMKGNLGHKRIPPKVLASILKSENNDLIKHLRKQLQKQREEEIRNSMQNKHHSFIEYGTFDFERSGLDVGRLNEKQRRLITILNKFNKKPFTKVITNQFYK